jgi:hypothetical protein
MRIGRGNRSTWKKPAPLPLCPTDEIITTCREGDKRSEPLHAPHQWILAWDAITQAVWMSGVRFPTSAFLVATHLGLTQSLIGSTETTQLHLVTKWRRVRLRLHTPYFTSRSISWCDEGRSQLWWGAGHWLRGLSCIRDARLSRRVESVWELVAPPTLPASGVRCPYYRSHTPSHHPSPGLKSTNNLASDYLEDWRGGKSIPEELGSNLGRDTRLPDWSFQWFPQSLQENSRISYRLGHDCFLPNPFKFIVNLVSYHWTLYRLAVFTRALQWFLSWAPSIQSIPPHTLMINLHIILPPKSRLF